MNMDILNPLFRGARDSETGDLGLSAAISADPLQARAHRLWRRVARECEAMADHAYGRGVCMSEGTALLVDQALGIGSRNDLQAVPLSRMRAGIARTWHW